MLSKYTKQMVLCYDGDQAGQNAAKRAIGILEKTGITVKVLRMQGAKGSGRIPEKIRGGTVQKAPGHVGKSGGLSAGEHPAEI